MHSDELRPRRQARVNGGGGQRRSSAMRHAGRTRRWPWAMTGVVLGITIVVGGVASVVSGSLLAQAGDYSGNGIDDVTVSISAGDTGYDVAAMLADHGVVKNVGSFYDLLLSASEPAVFHPGTYRLKTKMSAQSALNALNDPESRLAGMVMIPEGARQVQVFERLSEGTGIPAHDFVAAAADVASFGVPGEAQSLEGFLFPDTYTFSPGMSARAVLETMVNRQLDQLDAQGVREEDRWRTVILASIVEREARLPDDFFRIARVFDNRLAQGWRLQSDATVTYGTGKTHRPETTDDERADASNPYNTYVHEGLPVGPISNPGSLALEAILHPAEGSWLYFVTWNLESGETIFTNTLDEHEAAVSKWLDWMNNNPDYGG